MYIYACMHICLSQSFTNTLLMPLKSCLYSYSYGQQLLLICLQSDEFLIQAASNSSLQLRTLFLQLQVNYTIFRPRPHQNSCSIGGCCTKWHQLPKSREKVGWCSKNAFELLNFPAQLHNCEVLLGTMGQRTHNSTYAMRYSQ